MSIFKKIKKYFFGSKNNKVRVENETTMSITEREVQVYGQEKISTRRLYEQWACKETWMLYNEAIPLLLGIEPDKKIDVDDERKNEIEELFLHAQDCVNKKLLSVINSEKNEKEWQVRPIDLYRWATISRIVVPDELNDLMQFVMQTIKNPVPHKDQVIESDSRDASYQKHREIVLGAAMSLLVNSPGTCVNSKGKVKGNLIAKQILTNKKQWFGEEESLLAESAITDLIEHYFRLAKPVL